MDSYAIGIDIFDNEHRFEIDSFNYILCQYKNLKSLIVYDEDNELNYLFLSHNYLEELIIISGKNILYIWCENNNLKELDLSMCEKLQRLWCDIDIEKSLILPNHQLTLLNFI